MAAMHPTFTPRPDGIEIVDPVESTRFVLHTGKPVDPTPVDTGAFYFPVDHAVGVETGRIEIPKLGNVFVRRRDGSLVTDNADQTDVTLPADDYLLELTTTPMKLNTVMPTMHFTTTSKRNMPRPPKV